jgi:cation transport ATPase
MINLKKEQKRTLIMLGIAALPWLICVIFTMHWVIEAILCLFSIAVAMLEMLRAIINAVKERRFTERLLIISFAGLLAFVTGAFTSAALMFILLRLALMLAGDRYEGAVKMAQTRMELTYLNKYALKPEDKPVLDQKYYRLIDKYLTPALIVIAVIYAVLIPILTELSILKAIQRAAVIIAISGLFSVFGSFTLVDLAASARAAECGILFKQGYLARLIKTRLIYADLAETEELSGLRAISADASKLSVSSLLFLAATAYSYSNSETARKLAEAYGKPIDRSAVSEAQELEGLGVIAKIKGTVVCVGNSVFMNRIGLNIMPFSDDENTIHLGVGGRYAGRLFFESVDISEETFKEELEKLKIFQIKRAADIEDKCGDSEDYIYATNRTFPAERRGDNEIRLIMGGNDAEGDIYAGGDLRKDILRVLSYVSGADNLKKGCFVFVGIIKALVLLLALFGLMPIWAAILLEAVSVIYTYGYSLKAFDMEE